MAHLSIWSMKSKLPRIMTNQPSFINCIFNMFEVFCLAYLKWLLSPFINPSAMVFSMSNLGVLPSWPKKTRRPRFAGSHPPSCCGLPYGPTPKTRGGCFFVFFRRRLRIQKRDLIPREITPKRIEKGQFTTMFVEFCCSNCFIFFGGCSMYAWNQENAGPCDASLDTPSTF